MNATTPRAVGLALLTAVVLAGVGRVEAYTGQELVREAKITIDQARAIALKAHPGRITDEELEREGGGSGLRYSFDIKAGSVTQEVGVDAATGACSRTKPKAATPIDAVQRPRGSTAGVPFGKWSDHERYGESHVDQGSGSHARLLDHQDYRDDDRRNRRRRGDDVDAARGQECSQRRLSDRHGQIHGRVHCGRDRPDRDEKVPSRSFTGSTIVATTTSERRWPISPTVRLEWLRRRIVDPARVCS